MNRLHEFIADDERVFYPETLGISAEDQWWNAEALKELRDEYNIIFMSSGAACNPILVIPRENESPLVAIGVEDDGTVYFKRDDYGNYANSFDSGWIDSLIADLQAAKEFIKKLKEEKE
jgi:hypothetical protein